MATADPEQATIRATVHGRVQGVGFRQFIVEEARRLDLTGEVRNTRDGSVEVKARGPQPAVEELVQRLNDGPSLARVKDVDVQWDAPLPDYSAFRVSY